MKLKFSASLVSLFNGLVSAAKSFPYHKSEARIHHQSDRGNPDPEDDWYPHREEALRLVTPSGEVLHLQIRLEQDGLTTKRRVIVFGRRLKSIDHAPPNAQRATFNSDHLDETGFWLAPRLSSTENNNVARSLPGPALPLLEGKHIHLGSADPYVVLRRFLIALSAVESAKGGDLATFVPPFPKDSQTDEPEYEESDPRDLIFYQEGRSFKTTITKRTRCQRLLGEAQEFYRNKSSDGKLHCSVCRWSAPLPTCGEIVQIHHSRIQLRHYPRKGLRLSLNQALANLVPLCPNCHRLIEANPAGGCYSLEQVIAAHSPV